MIEFKFKEKYNARKAGVKEHKSITAELFKFYAVEVNYPKKVETGSSFGLFSYGTNYTIMDNWDTTAVFSKKTSANKYIIGKEWSWPDEARGGCIVEWEIDNKDIIWIGGRAEIDGWRVDYEIYWKEWNKLQAKWKQYN